MRFQVPQFINIEDKIGPLTIKQYIYTVGGVGMIYIAYHFLPFYIAIFIIAPVALLALALAFFPFNGKPFIFTLQAAIAYAFGNRLYIWRKKQNAVAPRGTGSAPVGNTVPVLGESRLKDLTWALDINQNVKR